MAMSIAVPLSLLEDIFRLLDYLDKWDAHDGDLHLHNSGYSHRFEHDNALLELRLKIKRLQSQIVETYLQTVHDITEDERHDLKEWVAGGNSVYDNPYSLYDESGRPMDFINGCRMGIEMSEYPSRFFCGGPDAADDGDWGEGLPF